MGVKNLAVLYFDDEFHPKIRGFSFHMLYFSLHAQESDLSLLSCFLLMKVQKNLPAIDETVH